MKRSRSSWRFEPLEPRLLLSADPVSAAVADALDNDSQGPDDAFADEAVVGALVREAVDSADRGESPDGLPAPLMLGDTPDREAAGHLEALLPIFDEHDEVRREIVFVDADTPDREVLLSGLGVAEPDRELIVVMLDGGRDGVSQIGEALAGYRGLDAVHIISHGAQGEMSLGDATLSNDTLARYESALRGWQASLGVDADLLLYGCDLAGSDAGRGLVEALAGLTGADVAASTDLTGQASRGGDWDLEYRHGEVESVVAIGQESQETWNGVLATLNVTTTADVVNGITTDILSLLGAPGGDGISLREAIIAANNTPGADIINLGSGTYTLAIAGTGEDGSASGDLDITDDLTIVGSSTAGTVIDGGGLDRVFHVHDDAAISVNLSKLTIQNGDENKGAGLRIDGTGNLPTVVLDEVRITGNDATGGNSRGGGIYNAGNLTVTDSLVDSNTTRTDGGGVYNFGTGTLSLINVTISGNDSGKLGGGLSNFGVASLTNVTVANNNATNLEGGVYADAGTTTSLTNVIIADNTGGSGADLAATVVSTGFNIVENGTGGSGFHVNDRVGVDPLLGTLQDNGGPTFTHAIEAASQAVGNGTSAGAPTEDQRGFARDGAPDIGAYEFQFGPNTAPAISLSNQVTTLAENATTTPRLKVADITITDDGNGTNTLALTGADAALFEIDGTALYLKAGTALDFETNATLDVNVTVDDATVGGTPDAVAALSIAVTDVNEAPTVSLNNQVTTLTENASTTPRVKVADITITDDALGTETLALTGADAALFEIDGTALYLKAGTALDFETNATLDVNVTVDDATVGGTPDAVAALSITVTDVNEAPTVSLSNQVTTLAENATTTPRMKVADITVTDDALGTETLALTGADAALFEIDGTALYLKAGTALDFETNATLDVNVTVDDATVGGTPDAVAALSIAVTDVNEAPTVSLSNPVTTLAENATTTPRVKVADITITDDALGTETLALTGADAALFEIDGAALYLKAGTALDFETNATLDVNVTVDDATVGGTPDAVAALSIAVTDVNEAPTVSLSNPVTTLAENATTTPRVKVADITITDDALGTETLALTGADAALFEIDGTALYLKAGTALDFETNATLDVNVTVDDATVGGTPDAVAALSITVTDVNEAPTVSLSNQVTTLAENATTTPRMKVADITITDDALGSETLALTGADAALFEIDGTELYLKAGTALDFETNATLDVNVTVDDATVGGTPDAVAALSIAVTDVNEAPTVSLSNPVTTLAENATTTPRVKVADITITDDALGSETLALTGADAALFEIDGAALYLKAGTALDFETNATLDVNVTVDDATVGGTPDAVAALSIAITDVNEAPTVSLNNQLTSFPENQVTSPRVKVADITVTDDALGTETLALTGADAALFEIDGTALYLKAGTALDFETNATLDVNVTVDDATVGGTPDAVASMSISVTDVNEKPAVSLSNTVTTLAENATTTPRVKVADITITDDALGSETLLLMGDDAALFEIDGTALYLKAGTALDFETNGTLNVQVRVDDPTIGGPVDDITVLNIAVTDVNEAPTVSLSNQVTTIAENATTTPRVKVADITITDDALGSETLGLTGADAALFEIDGTALYLKAGTALDFETNATLDVNVTVDDATVGGTPDAVAALSIAVTDVNEAPTVSLSNQVTTIAENASTTPRVKVADITITDDALGTETLALTGADAALFEIDGTALYLKAGTALDFETNATLDVNVTVDDATVGGTPDAVAALSIAVTDVNEAPTVSLSNPVTTLVENATTTPRVKVADITVTDDALGTETLALTGADAALFEIDGTALYLKAGTALDFETNATLDVNVTVDDATVGGTPDAVAALSIAVTDVNEAPTVSLSNPVTTLAENATTTPRVKVADITITDDALGSETLALTGADAALFEIDGTTLYLKAGTALDHGTNPILDVTVTVDDAAVGGTPDAVASMSVAVTDVAAPAPPPAPVFVEPPPTPVVTVDPEPETEPAPEAVVDEPVEEEADPITDSSGEPVEEVVEPVAEPEPEVPVDVAAAAEAAAAGGGSGGGGGAGASEGLGAVSIANRFDPGSILRTSFLQVLDQIPGLADMSPAEPTALGPTVQLDVDTVENLTRIVEGLNQLRDDVATDSVVNQATVASTVAVSTTLSVGYVVWLIRGGVLLSSVLSAMPAWQFVDPLPVLAFADDEDDEDEDGESLESIVGDASAEATG